MTLEMTYTRVYYGNPVEISQFYGDVNKCREFVENDRKKQDKKLIEIIRSGDPSVYGGDYFMWKGSD